MVTATTRTVDEARMDEALALAEGGRGRTSPNPMVGAVVVSGEGAIVGRGFHAQAGGAHAEVVALDAAARADGSGARGGTLYCTLEPCSHVGRTGPCVDRIVAAGVHRVVVAMVDPNPRVRGEGIARLRQAGVQVDVGVRRVEATRLNQPFVTWVTQGRPFVTMKIATSLDGRIAARAGARTQLTSDAAQAHADRLRAEVDAIAVGSETVLVDDPQLTSRTAGRRRPLTRVVFDRRLRVPPTARLLDTLQVGPVVIVTTEASASAQAAVVDRLRSVGAQVEVAASGSMTDAMARLGALELISIVLEGGTTVHRAAWNAGVVDRIHRYVAPVTLGSEGLAWLGKELTMTRLRGLRVESEGPDVLIEGYVHRVD